MLTVPTSGFLQDVAPIHLQRGSTRVGFVALGILLSPVVQERTCIRLHLESSCGREQVIRKWAIPSTEMYAYKVIFVGTWNPSVVLK